MSSKTRDNIKTVIEDHLDYLQREQESWKMERMGKEQRGQGNGNTSRIRLTKSPDILAAFKKDPQTLRHLNALLPCMCYGLKVEPEVSSDFSNLTDFLVIIDPTNIENESIV